MHYFLFESYHKTIDKNPEVLPTEEEAIEKQFKLLAPEGMKGIGTRVSATECLFWAKQAFSLPCQNPDCLILQRGTHRGYYTFSPSILLLLSVERPPLQENFVKSSPRLRTALSSSLSSNAYFWRETQAGTIGRWPTKIVDDIFWKRYP